MQVAQSRLGLAQKIAARAIGVVLFWFVTIIWGLHRLLLAMACLHRAQTPALFGFAITGDYAPPSIPTHPGRHRGWPTPPLVHELALGPPPRDVASTGGAHRHLVGRGAREVGIEIDAAVRVRSVTIARLNRADRANAPVEAPSSISDGGRDMALFSATSFPRQAGRRSCMTWHACCGGIAACRIEAQCCKTSSL